ncbi:nucleotidyltransferase domain-containing protein [uncultured Thiohalocapsa sp.]|jgi:predicted nucleotidyltransferase|uniref:type VII toxin-antitoxin system MntA family adenylyltransferase antitoxin n=1 Tax=uncultured Thiohalocapsa sp. TaxID=768990 RepID=UPI0025DABF7D|nr:nucleotidyltransferase domain-containing protein [uncultured Thiohalocapsa sp.]
MDPELVVRLTGALQREGADLCCAYLFGSAARGEDRPGSDVDVAVLFHDDPPRTLAGLHLDLADRLTGALGGRRVDLVVLNRAPVDLVHRVLRDGVLLLERDRSARIRFEVRARNEYFDLLPHLERYRRARDEVGR